MNVNTAMVIDDSESDQFLAKIQIEKFDESIEVMQAFDGVEALEMLEELDKKPDVIFLDINMPRMNGLEFLEKYSEHDDHSTVVAMLTSSDQNEDKDTAMSYPFVKKYFVKILDGADLNAVKDLQV